MFHEHFFQQGDNHYSIVLNLDYCRDTLASQPSRLGWVKRNPTFFGCHERLSLGFAFSRVGWVEWSETQHCLNATNGCCWVSPCSTQSTLNTCKIPQMADVGFTQPYGTGRKAMQYRRSKTPGATFFFTVVTYRRNKILCHEANVALIKEAFLHVTTCHPFRNRAFVLLPDHIHCLWTLPEMIITIRSLCKSGWL